MDALGRVFAEIGAQQIGRDLVAGMRLQRQRDDRQRDLDQLDLVRRRIRPARRS